MKIHLLTSVIFRAFVMVTCLISIGSCSDSALVKNNHLTVSIEPLRYLVEYLADDRFEVTTITPEGANPESYSPTPQQMMSLSEGLVYFRMGTLGFERAQLRKIAANRPHLYIINVSEGIEPLPHCGSCDSEGGDPHTWTSPQNMKIISQNIYHALCNIDSAHAGFYAERLKLLHAHIDSIDHIIHQKVDSLPTRTFLINHPSLAYFANDYDLHQISIEHDGKEASAQRMAMLIDYCREHNIRKIFVQKQHSRRGADHIAKEIGAEVIEINPLSYHWSEEMLNIANRLNP